VSRAKRLQGADLKIGDDNVLETDEDFVDVRRKVWGVGIAVGAVVGGFIAGAEAEDVLGSELEEAKRWGSVVGLEPGVEPCAGNVRRGGADWPKEWGVRSSARKGMVRSMGKQYHRCG